jgi:hypothetical protein
MEKIRITQTISGICNASHPGRDARLEITNCHNQFQKGNKATRLKYMAT